MGLTIFISLMLSASAAVTAAQSSPLRADPEVDKNGLSVHPVRRGDMPLRLTPIGEIVSLTPPEVSVTVPSGSVSLTSSRPAGFRTGKGPGSDDGECC